jgi:hypothetical protein
MRSHNFGQEVQAEIVKTVRRGQEVVIEAIKTWTDQVRTITPPMREVNLPFADKLPKREEVLGNLPKPEELLNNAYDLAEKLLAGQRKFAEDVLHAAAPLLPGRGDTAPAKNGTAAHKTGETTAHKAGETAARKTGGTTARKAGGTTARKTGTGAKSGTARKTGGTAK